MLLMRRAVWDILVGSLRDLESFAIPLFASVPDPSSRSLGRFEDCLLTSTMLGQACDTSSPSSSRLLTRRRETEQRFTSFRRPVGFKSMRSYASMKQPDKRIQYCCEILDGGAAPEFRLTAGKLFVNCTLLR